MFYMPYSLGTQQNRGRLDIPRFDTQARTSPHGWECECGASGCNIDVTCFWLTLFPLLNL